MAWAHPVLFRRLEDARRANPELKLIVADPRRTETAAAADLHLQLLPGTDVVLHHALLHVLLWEGLADMAFIARAHHRLRGAARPRARIHAGACGQGLRPEGRRHRAGRALVRRCRGRDRAPRADAVAVLPGPEPEPQRHRQEQHADQPAPGHRADRPARRRAVLADRPAQCDGRARGRRPGQPAGRAPRPGQRRAPRRSGRAVGRGPTSRPSPARARWRCSRPRPTAQIKALWIVCTNPAQSMPDQAAVRRALQRAEFVVLQEAYATPPPPTFADLLLPASSWGEKSGTVTNSERRISRVRAARAAAGAGARRLAHRASTWRGGSKRGCRRAARRAQRCSPTTRAESVWNEHRDSTRGRDLDITGLSYAALEQPQQWPCPAGAARATPRLYTDGRFATPDGRARFVAPAWRPTAELRDARFPVSLTTGRLRDQWHGMSRTGTLGRLFAPRRRTRAGAAPAGAGAAPLGRRRPGARAARAAARWCCRCAPATAVPPAQAFIAMHWGPEYMAGTGRQRADHRRLLPAVAAARAEACRGAAGARRAALAAGGRGLAAAGRGAGRCASGCAACSAVSTMPCACPSVASRSRAWACCSALPRPDPSSPRWPSWKPRWTCDDGAVLRYADAGAQPAPRHAPAWPTAACRPSCWPAMPRRRAGCSSLLQQGQPAAAYGRALLAARRQPPQPVAPRSRQVCACHDVSEEAIVGPAARHAHGDAGQRLQQLQAQLRCGTECGSCLPALKAAGAAAWPRQASGPA